jgi:DNA/RNA-binding domain of Phe-tRNA-synthetase-like protein
MDEARKFLPIKALRGAYRTLGNDPTRYRGSNEALVRRIVQGKELYRVNTVVDINNLISLETLHSAGTFDLDRVQPPIIFRVGQPGETYTGIGRGEIKIEGLPVFADRAGPFGSTTSDSERTMVRLDTTQMMMVVISFLGVEGVDAVLGRAMGLLEKHAAATGIETKVVA